MKVERKICVAFDMDDTLFKEYFYVRTGRRAVAEAFAATAGQSVDSLVNLIFTKVESVTN